eukprot:JP446264.1.p1 GENE.JP446264.1~~JP446264.1.p1  ORF type:complete len:290 (+),score=16.54 JP446264.1:43-912(+)
MSCPECGVRSVYGGAIKWRVDPGYQGRICSRCHSSDWQWPSNNTVEKIEANIRSGDIGDHFLRASRGHNDHERPHPHSRCGHVCARRRTQFDAGCCACAGSTAPCSQCYQKLMVSSMRSSSGAEAARNMQQVLFGVDGTSVSLSHSAVDDRAHRLRGHTMRLFHQTDSDAAQGILRNGFQRGSGGLAGGGIYFADNEVDTCHKAHRFGVILSATVLLGNVKNMSSSGDRNVTFKSLLDRGYDSVMIPRSGTEYAVYNSDQVTDIRIAAYYDKHSNRSHPHNARSYIRYA